MGFKSYRFETDAEGAVHLSDPQALRFSGPEGLVAIWLSYNKDAANRTWNVEPDQWFVLMGQLWEVGRRWIVFEQEDDEGRLRLAQVRRVTGICHAERTEMSFSMAPLVVCGQNGTTTVRPEGSGRIWSEELALEGTPWNAQAPWYWCKPKLSIGSATLGKRLR